MEVRAEIKVYGAACGERHALGVAVTDAIRKLYESREQWEMARQNQVGAGAAFSALQAARGALEAARHAYDEHLRVHGCLPAPRAAGAAV